MWENEKEINSERLHFIFPPLETEKETQRAAEINWEEDGFQIFALIIILHCSYLLLKFKRNESKGRLTDNRQKSETETPKGFLLDTVSMNKW